MSRTRRTHWPHSLRTAAMKSDHNEPPIQHLQKKNTSVQPYPGHLQAVAKHMHEQHQEQQQSLSKQRQKKTNLVQEKLRLQVERLQAQNAALHAQNEQLRAELARERAAQASDSAYPHEAWLRTLLESSPVGITIERGADKLYMNPAAEAACGYTIQELRQMSPEQYVHPESLTMLHQRLAARQRGEPLSPHFDICLLKKGGGERWLDVMTIPIAYEGQPAVLSISIDITARKQAEQERTDAYQQIEAINHLLQRGRVLMNTVFHALDDGFVVLDQEGRVLTSNLAAQTLFGCAPEELLNQPWEALSYQQRGQTEIPTFPGLWVLEALRSGQTQRRRERLRCADGQVRTFDIQSIPVLAAGDQPNPELAVLRMADITEHLRMEALQIERERSAASRQMTEIVAHEVNTPLQTLLASLEMIPDTDEEERTDYLRMAQHEIERISSIVQTLKTWHTLPDDVHGSVDVHTLIRNVLHSLNATLVQRQIHVRCELAEDIPLVDGRTDQLTQVLLNLVTYAADTVPHRGALLLRTRLDRRAHQTDVLPAIATPRVIVEIIDSSAEPASSPQIETEHTTRHTEPLASHSTMSRCHLSLALSRRIVTQHGGYLSIHSQIGSRTTFTLALPLSEEAAV